MSTEDSRFRPNAIGIPWCREEDYGAFVAIFEDANNLPITWDEFIQRAQASEDHYKLQGYIVERVYIDLQTFPDWCRRQGYRIDAQARARFAARIAVARNADSD
jgi:hypothetical protein